MSLDVPAAAKLLASAVACQCAANNPYIVCAAACFAIYTYQQWLMIVRSRELCSMHLQHGLGFRQVITLEDLDVSLEVFNKVLASNAGTVDLLRHHVAGTEQHVSEFF